MSVFKKFSSIFLDPSVFNLKYVPKQIVGRDKEVDKIAHSMLRNKNVLIKGGSGSGKTATMLYVADCYSREVDNPLPTPYVTMANRKSYKSLVHSLYIEMGGSEVSSFVRATVADFVIFLKGKKFYPIIDEFEILGLEDFGRLVKLFESLDVKGAFITNNILFNTTIKSEISNRLVWTICNFDMYSDDLIYKILKQRVNMGLIPESLSDDVLMAVPGICRKNKEMGDSRLAIQTISEAASYVEVHGKLKITLTDLNRASKLVLNKDIADSLKGLDEDHQMILLVLGLKKTYTSTLFKSYVNVCTKAEKNPASYATFWRKLNDLETKFNFIQAASVDNMRGKPRRITTTIDKDYFKDIEKILLELLNLKTAGVEISQEVLA